MRPLSVVFLAVSIVARQADVLTQYNDNQRSGVNTQETILNVQRLLCKWLTSNG